MSGRVITYIRENQETLGFGLVNEATDLWRTTNGCVYRAAGAGGSITGRRADLFIIDDPIKGRQDADSPTIRDMVWNWYRAEVLTRLNPGARVILIQTRWHEDDLAGRLLAEMANGGRQWRIINLPAVTEDDDALGREPGQALWPERFPVPLDDARRDVGEREWAALYQQRPRPQEGSLFKVHQIAEMPAGPQCTQVVRSWDLAGTRQMGSRDPNWTVGLKLGRMASGAFVVLDIVRLRGGPDEVEAAIVNTATHDGRSVKIRSRGPGQASKQQVLYYSRKLAGHTIVVEKEGASKEQRALPVASQCNVGNLSVLANLRHSAEFRDELAAFPWHT